MMAAVILNGAKENDTLSLAMMRCLEKMLSAHYYRVSSYMLAQEPIENCAHCLDCWIKNPGKCQITDHCQDISIKLINSSLVVAITPVTFGGYSSELKRIIDRQLPTMLPFYEKVSGETHHMKRYSSYPTWLFIGLIERHNESREELFHRLVARNSISLFGASSKSLVLTRDISAYEMQVTLTTGLSRVGVL